MFKNLFFGIPRSAQIFTGTWLCRMLRGPDDYVNNSANFQIIKYSDSTVENVTFFNAQVVFYNSSLLRFNNPTNNFIGINSPNNENVFLFSLEPELFTKSKNFTSLLSALVNTEIGKKVYNLTKMRKNLEKFFNLTEHLETLMTIGLSKRSGKSKISYFRPGFTYEGEAITKFFHFYVNASQILPLNYIIEGKKFGLFEAVVSVLTYYAWKELKNAFTTVHGLLQLSPFSLSMIISLDFCFALYLFDITTTSQNLYPLFAFVSTVSLTIFFQLQIRVLLNVWKAQVLSSNDARILRKNTVIFFTTIGVTLLSTPLANKTVFTYPVIPLLFLYSMFIPQIIQTAVNEDFNKKDSFFVCMITIIRAAQLYYFSCYNKNIEETHNVGIFIFFLIWLLLQCIVVLLQNKFGGRFFLPGSFKSIPFDYGRIPVPDGSECEICLSEILPGEPSMVTPCGHPFHRECLTRWMQDHDICPICRQYLPQLSNEYLL